MSNKTGGGGEINPASQLSRKSSNATGDEREQLPNVTVLTDRAEAEHCPSQRSQRGV